MINVQALAFTQFLSKKHLLLVFHILNKLEESSSWYEFILTNRVRGPNCNLLTAYFLLQFMSRVRSMSEYHELK